MLPTMLDILNIESPEKTDGKSAYSAAVRNRDEFKMLKRDLSGWIRMPESEFEQRKAQKTRERVAKYGQGKDGPERIYRIGPNQQLIGQKAQSAGTSQSKVTLTAPRAYANVESGRRRPSRPGSPAGSQAASSRTSPWRSTAPSARWATRSSWPPAAVS